MKKIFTLLLGLALAGGCASAANKQNIYEWKDGGVNVRNIEVVDSVTFDVPNLFVVTCSEPKDITDSSFSGTVTIAYGDGISLVTGNWPDGGICYSDTNTEPTWEDGDMWVGDEPGSYDFTVKDLIVNTKYYCRAYVLYCGVTYYSDVFTVQTTGEKAGDNSTVINGHNFIDLGLPSGTLWAEANLGAATKADYGNYYAWGETTTKDVYSWATYNYGDSTQDVTKYNDKDKKTTLEADDDAATKSWGDPCRMPTITEFDELLENCSNTWTTFKNSDGEDIEGNLLTSKLNGNTIFFPAGGSKLDSDLNGKTYVGSYWTSTVPEGYIGYASFAQFIEYGGRTDDMSRQYGYSVRPVAVAE